MSDLTSQLRDDADWLVTLDGAVEPVVERIRRAAALIGYMQYRVAELESRVEELESDVLR